MGDGDEDVGRRSEVQMEERGRGRRGERRVEAEVARGMVQQGIMVQQEEGAARRLLPRFLPH